MKKCQKTAGCRVGGGGVWTHTVQSDWIWEQTLRPIQYTFTTLCQSPSHASYTASIIVTSKQESYGLYKKQTVRYHKETRESTNYNYTRYKYNGRLLYFNLTESLKSKLSDAKWHNCSKCCPLAQTYALILGCHWSTALSASTQPRPDRN